MIETAKDKSARHVVENGVEKVVYDPLPLHWRQVVIIPTIQIMGIVGLINMIINWNYGLFIFSYFYGTLAGFGVTGGVHRLWSHRSFKAKLPLKIILGACYATNGQKSIIQWARDHRVHHKHSDTNADPHNASRGFFFSHIGWLMHKKHPDCIAEGKKVDISDLLSDPFVVLHSKYFFELSMLFVFAIPIFVPWYFFGSTFWHSFWACWFRYAWTLNNTWLINSAAHHFGYRPYSSKIKPTESMLVSLALVGEGWHNYHHTFPWDYKASELRSPIFNPTTALLDFFASIGWAYDLKSPSKELVEKVSRRHGDGTREHTPEVNEEGEIVHEDVEHSKETSNGYSIQNFVRSEERIRG